MKTRRFGLAVLVGLLAPAAARAGYNYQYTFDQPSYAAAAGGTVSVGVFLQETVSGGDVSRLATDGLIGAGVRLRFDIAPLPGSPAQILSSAAISPNAKAFDDPFGAILGFVPGSYAQLSEVVDVTSPAALGSLVAPNTFRLFLGSFQFTVGTVAGQVTTIRALDIPTSSDTVTNAGLVLDPLIQSADVTIRVNTVPEPSAAMLLGVSMLCLLASSRGKERGRGGKQI